MNNNRWIRYLPYFIVLPLLLYAAKYDLSINQALYQPDHGIALFYERFLLIPMECLIPLTCMAFAKLHHKKVLSIFAFLSFLIIFLHALDGMLSLESSILLSIVLSTANTWFLTCIPKHIWQRYQTFFHFLAFVLVTTFLITLIIKQLWGRVRYREMMDPLMQFQPWYLPNGMNGHHSFPSNHTAFMTLILCPLFAKEFNRNSQTYRWAMILFCFGMIISMMYSRMILGAHFLSDTLIGFSIAYTCILIGASLFYHKKELKP